MEVKFAFAFGEQVKDTDSGIIGRITTAVFARGPRLGYWIAYTDNQGKAQEVFASEDSLARA